MSLFVGLRGDGLGALAKNIEMYLETWQACGYDGAGDVFRRVPVYVIDTQAAAPKGGNAVCADMSAELSTLSHDDILGERLAFWTAAQLIERVSDWRDVLSIDGITAELNAGNGLSEVQVKNSLRILTSDVMQAFKLVEAASNPWPPNSARRPSSIDW